MYVSTIDLTDCLYESKGYLHSQRYLKTLGMVTWLCPINHPNIGTAEYLYTQIKHTGPARMSNAEGFRDSGTCHLFGFGIHRVHVVVANNVIRVRQSWKLVIRTGRFPDLRSPLASQRWVNVNCYPGSNWSVDGYAGRVAHWRLWFFLHGGRDLPAPVCHWWRSGRSQACSARSQHALR